MSDQPLQITRDDLPPLGGWVFTVPQTGARLTALSSTTLRDMVKRHLTINKIEVPKNFRQWFEDALCTQANLEGVICARVPIELPEPVRTLEWRHLESFAKAVWNWSKGPGKFKLVDREVANERARICSTCPMNVKMELGCRGCRGLLKRVSEVVKEQTTDYDGKLHDCAICGCVLNLKVHCPDHVIEASEKDRGYEFPENCWRVNQSSSSEL